MHVAVLRVCAHIDTKLISIVIVHVVLTVIYAYIDIFWPIKLLITHTYVMDLIPVKTNLLVLRGVYPDDMKAQTVVETPVHVVSHYTSLPKRFESADSWPKTSNLKCWECDQVPTDYPKFIPRDPELDAAGGMACDVYGHFCEWNCAVSFIEKEYPREQRWDSLQNLYIFEGAFSGSRKGKILRAPPKYIMQEYCGAAGITQQQYRDKITALNKIATRRR
jgi:hypothetical protein